MFAAQAYNPRKTKVIDIAFAETREEAAAILFARNPKLKTATTSRAYEFRGELTASGSDTRWIDRDGFKPMQFSGTSVRR